jgi:hypothetical protein
MSLALVIDDYLIETPSVVLPDPAARLMDVSAGIEKARRSVEEQRAKFEELHLTAKGLSPDELQVVIKALLDRERLQAAILSPIY